MNTGIHYFNPIKNLGIGFTIRNIAHQLTTYQSSKENTSPLVIEMGLSKRLKHLPLVYHISLKHLEQWDLRYDNPSDRQSNSVFENQKEASKFDKLLGNSFRHFGFGIELFLSKKKILSYVLVTIHYFLKTLHWQIFDRLQVFVLVLD